jgi:Outer membrane protein beta-barrel domain
MWVPIFQRRTALRKNIAIVFTLFLMTAAGVAQVPSFGNVFLGYSFNRADTGLSNRANLNGWEGSVEAKVFPFVGVVADFSGQYGKLRIPSQGVDERDRVQSYLFGPRVSVTVGKIRPFAHVLIGAAQFHASDSGFSSSETDFADAIGGGIDYHLIPRVSWRVQADALQTHFFGERQNDARISTGLVMKF